MTDVRSTWISLILSLLAIPCLADNDRLTVLGGTVIDAATKAPVRKAHVTLETAGDGKKPELMATTDEMGRFRFADIETGRYRLIAEKNGFLEGAYGANQPEAEGSILKVGGGEKLPSLTLRLFPASSISGHVLDADGDPVAGGAVMIFTRARRGGKTSNENKGAASTNRAGEFHIDELAPGTYYLNASGEDSWGLPKRRVPVDSAGKATNLHDLKTFYPSGLSIAEAQGVMVESGQEQAGIDIRLQRGTTVSVKGRITGMRADARSYQLTASVEAGNGWTPESGTISLNGEFTFEALPPGTHRLTLLENGANGLFEAGWTDVTLSDQDVTGVVITPIKPARLRVRVVMEGEEDKPLTAGSVMLISGLTAGQATRTLAAFQPQNGAYIIDEVPSGKYWIQFSNSGKTYLKSVQSGGRMLDPRAIEMSEDATLDLLMTYSKNVASVVGDVEEASEKNEEPVQAVLVPLTAVMNASSGEWDLDVRWKTLDQTGHFLDENVQPGKYLAFAVQGTDYELWHNADFVKAIRTAGSEFEVEEQAHASVHLKPIPTEQIEELRKRLGL